MDIDIQRTVSGCALSRVLYKIFGASEAARMNASSWGGIECQGPYTSRSSALSIRIQCEILCEQTER
ncbi:MAG: hypothetical protein HXS47_06535 [Theionarchaea archaeon]|nr:hypothetical protein [Theionarchaea archaeon]